jgi:hypothetical protein
MTKFFLMFNIAKKSAHRQYHPTRHYNFNQGQPLIFESDEGNPWPTQLFIQRMPKRTIGSKPCLFLQKIIHSFQGIKNNDVFFEAFKMDQIP